MFIRNRLGASNTVEIVFIVLVALIATVGPIYRVFKSVGNRYNEMANNL